MSLPDALPHLLRLRAQADTLFDRTLSAHRAEMQCRPGCFGCCQGGLTLTQVEAHTLAEAIHTLEPSARARLQAHLADYLARADASYCALLVEGQCALYAARPLICRTHGMPLRFTDDADQVFVDVCPLNFQTLPLEQLDPAFMLDLDHLNTALVMIDRLAAQGAERVAILDLLCEELPLTPLEDCP